MYSLTIIFISFVLLAILLVSRSKINNNYENNPASYSSSKNSILVMILSYNFNRFDPLLLMFKSFQEMCENGWNVNIMVFTTIPIVSESLYQYLLSKLYCQRIQNEISLQFSYHLPSIQHELCVETRKYLKQFWERYDISIYLEEDMILEYRQLVYYLNELKLLSTLVGEEIAYQNYYIGFQRYRRHSRPFHLNKELITEKQIYHQEYLEEIPYFKPICIKNATYLQVIGNKRVPAANVYQAMWILTKPHIKVLQLKCKFLDQASKTHGTGYLQEYIGSLSLFENDLVPGNCGLIKLIPGKRLIDFSILHYYHSTDPMLLRTSHPLYITYQHIMTGMLQSATPISYAGYYDQQICWTQTISKYRLLYNISLPKNHTIYLKSYTNNIGKGSNTISYILRNGYKYSISQSIQSKIDQSNLILYSMKHPMFDDLPLG